MNYLEGHLVFMQKLFGRLLQRQQFVGMQVTLVVGGPLPGKIGFFKSSMLPVSRCGE